MQRERYWRDSSNRLTFDSFDVPAVEFPSLCREIGEAFAIEIDTPVVGPDQMFTESHRGNQIIGLDWDIWMGFMVVAKNVEAESLVREIAAWLIAREGHSDPAG